MNIFFLDKDPIKAAQCLCDKHVVKLTLETAQLLSTAHRVLDTNCPDFLYKATHVNHPCSIWTRYCIDNYDWLCQYGIAICNEYTYRYGKTHKCQKIIEWCNENPIFGCKYSSYTMTKPALAMPDEFKHSDPVQAYRQYYAYKQTVVDMKWTKRNKPYWLETMETV